MSRALDYRRIVEALSISKDFSASLAVAVFTGKTLCVAVFSGALNSTTDFGCWSIQGAFFFTLSARIRIRGAVLSRACDYSTQARRARLTASTRLFPIVQQRLRPRMGEPADALP